MQRKVTRRNDTLFYPWDQMRVGDWFYAPASMRSPGSVSSAASQRTRETGEEYETSLIKNARGRPVTIVTRLR